MTQHTQAPSLHDESTQVHLYSETFLSLLMTNEPPQPSDEALARAEIERGEKQRNAIDKEIEKLKQDIEREWKTKNLQEKLSGSIQRRRLVDRFIEDHKLIISPFRRCRLPTEIWAQIFHYAEPTVSLDDAFDVSWTRSGIWRLGRVCSDWRAVLLSYGSLWSKLDVSITSWSAMRYAQTIVEEALSRSRNAPLKISLHILLVGDCGGRVSSGEYNGYISALIQTLTGASHRWHTICLGQMPAQQLSLFSEAKDRIPMLTDLTYRCQMPWPDAFNEAPSLRKLTLSGTRPATLQLPWSQLTKCNIDCIDNPRQELDLLRACTSLEEYSCRCYGKLVATDMVCVPRLHTLSLSMRTAVLDNLILPSLASVVLDGTFNRDPKKDAGAIGRFRNLVSRSSANLRAVKIKLLPKSSQVTFGTFLTEACFANLTSLRVTYRVPCDKLIDMLAIKPKNEIVVLPRLERLHLHPIYIVHEPAIPDSDRLVQMVRSRCMLTRRGQITSQLCLLEYTADAKSEKPPLILAGTLAPLLRCRNEGLKLKVDSFYVDEKRLS